MTTTYGIVARDAPTAVIFRRGPTRHTRLLCWNLRDDTIRAGQWLIGSLHPRPCGVSPNGELLVYEARKAGKTFTAISRPPYFTALAFWDYSSPWTGGGFFADDKTVVLGLTFKEPYAGGAFPRGFEVTDVWKHFSMSGRAAATLGSLVAKTPQANHGWSVDQKPNPRRPRLTLERIRSGRHQRTYAIVDGAIRTELDPVDWADWAHDGSLLLGKGGCLYRQRLPDPPYLVADLTQQSFEKVEPTKDALRWPGKSR